MAKTTSEIVESIKVVLGGWDAPVNRILSDCFQLHVRFAVETAGKRAEWLLRDSKGSPQVLPFAVNSKGERVFSESEAAVWLPGALKDRGLRMAVLGYLISALMRGSANADAAYQRASMLSILLVEFPLPKDARIWGEPDAGNDLVEVKIPELSTYVKSLAEAADGAKHRKTLQRLIRKDGAKQTSSTRPPKDRTGKVSSEDIFSL